MLKDLNCANVGLLGGPHKFTLIILIAKQFSSVRVYILMENSFNLTY